MKTITFSYDEIRAANIYDALKRDHVVRVSAKTFQYYILVHALDRIDQEMARREHEPVGILLLKMIFVLPIFLVLLIASAKYRKIFKLKISYSLSVTYKVVGDCLVEISFE